MIDRMIDGGGEAGGASLETSADEPNVIEESGKPKHDRLGAFRALRHRNYRLYFFGQLTSLAGSWMQSAAQAWLVLRLTNSSMMLGIVSAAQFAPILLVGLFAGVFIDRVDLRRMLVATQTLMMLSAFALAGLTWTHVVRVEHVILLAAFNGIVRSFDMPGRQSFVVEMVGREDLANGIALNSMIVNGARMFGPAIAGVVIAWLGTATCFFLNGVSFLAVIWSLIEMDVSPRAWMAPESRVLKQLREGLTEVWQRRSIFYQMVLAGVNNGFGNQYTVLIPIFAQNVLHGGARGYGLLVAIQGLGSVIGAATLASRVTTRGIRNNLIIGLIASGVGISFFGLSRSMILSLIAQMVVGAGLTNFRASNNTLIQLFVSDKLRGRVMSCYQLASIGLTPIGSLAIGYMGTRMGPPETVLICGIMTLSCALALLTGLRQIGADPAS
jgi:MFS family permease